MVSVAYLGAGVLFILALAGLSNNEQARRGNLYGMLGMALAIAATVFGDLVTNYTVLLIAILVGGAIGLVIAQRVRMTQMPQLVAILHSLVGLAAVIIGYTNFVDSSISLDGTAQTIHLIETSLGIYIGALTFSGSVIAFGRLSALISGKPILLPGRHVLNFALAVGALTFGWQFVTADSIASAQSPLIGLTIIALVYGVHMVIAIGGADMPVVISMLNSYSGWAAAATGFMLGNDLLIVVGALVGSSGAILSYIMCRAMNRNFFSVIAGGFGSGQHRVKAVEGKHGEVVTIDAAETARLLGASSKVMFVPGYGMAMAQAQHAVAEVTRVLMGKGVNVRFGVHPVAGRMPGHMNVLLAEANVPYDIVFEMDEVNDDFINVDITVVIGANDTVNPSAAEEPDSPIAGMPVMQVWRSKTTVVLKRGMATGYAGVDNPLFYKDNTRMLFGDAKACMNDILQLLNR